MLLQNVALLWYKAVLCRITWRGRETDVIATKKDHSLKLRLAEPRKHWKYVSATFKFEPPHLGRPKSTNLYYRLYQLKLYWNYL